MEILAQVIKKQERPGKSAKTGQDEIYYDIQVLEVPHRFKLGNKALGVTPLEGSCPNPAPKPYDVVIRSKAEYDLFPLNGLVWLVDVEWGSRAFTSKNGGATSVFFINGYKTSLAKAPEKSVELGF